ncbi:c-type cytochrome [Novosphingobium flavum]|uniref:C-type cytochrome n=1 Tax=Novosphingobium flavum TaxID=1778672 RepID=A0A7X1KN81_9SPHN|nr:c-type cytochrome [Novosphingobium flavum]MBC2667153.1 c-type cytochrome [Novosphingobium flavum]
MKRPALTLSLVAALGLIAQPGLAQSAADGKTAFATCAACHGTKAGEKKVGPTLAGVVGRKSGSLPGFAYSPALAKAGKVWSPAQLDAFLAAPMKVVPGTRMVIAVPDAKRRADLIAYLATLK